MSFKSVINQKTNFTLIDTHTDEQGRYVVYARHKDAPIFLALAGRDNEIMAELAYPAIPYNKYTVPQLKRMALEDMGYPEAFDFNYYDTGQGLNGSLTCILKGQSIAFMTDEALVIWLGVVWEMGRKVITGQCNRGLV